MLILSYILFGANLFFFCYNMMHKRYGWAALNGFATILCAFNIL